jgi:hypothetical protein
MTTPVELGFKLEELIHDALSKIDGFECMKEHDIRNYFNDQSFNGVDHWIKYKDNHILIQDKWKETITQPEIAQFLTCVERIQARNSKSDNYYLIWASKKEPTTNASKSLIERNVNIITCSTSISSLARIVVMDICESFDINPINSLMNIPSCKKLNTTTQISQREHVATQTVTYDDSDEGKEKKTELLAIIQQIQNGPFRKVINSLGMCPIPQARELAITVLPKSIDDWQQSKANKFNYSKLLSDLKKICWPNKNKKVYYGTLNSYIKLHFISKELNELTQKYMNIRHFMISNRSTWAKGTLEIKCDFEPLTQEDYSVVCKFTDGYWKGMEYQFWQEYQSVY